MPAMAEPGWSAHWRLPVVLWISVTGDVCSAGFEAGCLARWPSSWVWLTWGHLLSPFDPE